MSSNGLPDYELDHLKVISAPNELRAAADPLRATILDLVLERAATVAELAQAVARPKGTVAYHVGLLVDAGLLRVVRTRRVRAVDERYYGRTARIFYVGSITAEQARGLANHLAAAAAESAPAHESDDLRAILRHARIPRDRAAEFWSRVMALATEFSALPRAGDTVYGFAAGLYPTDHPSLPDRDAT